MSCAIRPGPSSSLELLTRHITMKKSAANPLEVNHLCPLSTYSSPSRTAVVWMERGSEPGVFRLRHGEARLHRPFDQREQPLALLVLGAVLDEDRLVPRVGCDDAEERRRADGIGQDLVHSKTTGPAAYCSSCSWRFRSRATYTFGKMVHSVRHGATLLFAMLLLFGSWVAFTSFAEHQATLRWPRPASRTSRPGTWRGKSSFRRHLDGTVRRLLDDDLDRLRTPRTTRSLRSVVPAS